MEFRPSYFYSPFGIDRDADIIAIIGDDLGSDRLPGRKIGTSILTHLRVLVNILGQKRCELVSTVNT